MRLPCNWPIPTLCCFVLLVASTVAPTAWSAPPRLRLVPVAENAFLSPVAITNAGDGSHRLFVVDQRGRVHIIDSSGTLLPTPFLDISAKLVPERSGFDERGLLSLAFHPSYASNGRFYVYYSAPSPNAPGTEAAPVDHQSVVAEYTVSGDANLADANSERILLTFDQPQFNHDGGQVAFGPDTLLYISTGDGGGSNDNDAGHTGGSILKPDGGLGNSQDLTKPLGKILRIDPLGNAAPGGQYSIPASNPFSAGGDDALDEIFAYGLRNPWRFSFDRQTGQLFCADVGQGDVEEVNIIESGKNYGWRRFEGSFDFDPTAPTTGNTFEPPIGQYAHPNSNIPGLLNIGSSITGGYVYRGSLIPDLVGTYVFGDWTSSFSSPSGTLLALESKGPDFDLSILDIESGNPVNFFIPAFGEDESGEIYVAGKTTLAPSAGDPLSGGPTGSIYRLALAVPLAPLPAVRLEPVVEAAFPSPVAITHAGDGSGRVFIVDQRGKIHIIDSAGQLVAPPFLDISAKLVPERSGFDERGLLSAAFHPDYTDNGKFYVYYSAPSPNAPGTENDPVNHRSVIAEYTVSGDANVADVSSERIILTFDQPQFNHDGGQVAFGPDKLLYISTGDGGGSNDNDAGHTGGSILKPDGGLGNSQDLTKLLGKILRIDPLGNAAPGGQYSIPASNPFSAGGDNALDEIFAYGLRNPWRFSFDRQTGQLFCADVGQGDVEEVNIIGSGKNYGWRRFEGAFDFDPTAPTTGSVFEAPIGQYAHPNSTIPGIPNVGTSITGGYVYRGTESPGLAGAYLFGDWTNSFRSPNGTILALTPGASPGSFDLGALKVEGGNPIGMYLPAFGEDEDGEIYVAGKTTLAPSAGDPDTGGPSGGIFKLVEITGGPGTSGSASLPAASDTTIYEEGNLANGTGGNLFSGTTVGEENTGERRALLKFDIASGVPAGANIDTATVTLRMNKTPSFGSNNANFGLHPLTKDWGEGSVNASGQEGKGSPATTGSATWISSELNIGPDWTVPGGDYVATPSASRFIALTLGFYDWTSATLAADVKRWLDTPANNFGWILRTDSSALGTARRFSSGEASVTNNRPELNIDYTVPDPIPTHRENWLELYYPGDDFPGDLSNEDDDQNNALIEYGVGTNPNVNDADPLVSTFDSDTGDLTICFVRDPRATDLTYVLQVSIDIESWMDVASSGAGSSTTGNGGAGIVESNILGQHPLKKVAVTLPATIVGETRLFTRLSVSREAP